MSCYYRGGKNGGEEWIRTTVGRSQQIYSLPPLATRAPHHLRVVFIESRLLSPTTAILAKPSCCRQQTLVQDPLPVTAILAQPSCCRQQNGAQDGTRIRDLFLTKEVLYRLSYLGTQLPMGRHYGKLRSSSKYGGL